jgi:hypothetical protein
MLPLLRRKLARRDRWERIFLERLTEPVHLNLLSVLVLLFGSFRMKVAWDLVIRQQYAYGILKAADLARENGRSRVTVIEVGVAAGAGLMNMAMIAARVQEETGVGIDIHGFDAGAGMPPARDHRDHPELYAEGDFPMDVEGLRRILPPNVTLHIGPLTSTVPAFLESCTPAAPIGFVAFDVDYYSSTVEAVDLLKGSPELYLPITVTYLDDIALEPHNSAAGVLLAVEEFNASTPLRQLEHHPFFTRRRIFTRAIWVQQVYLLHVLDHATRSRPATTAQKRIIDNPYLETGAASR